MVQMPGTSSAMERDLTLASLVRLLDSKPPTSVTPEASCLKELILLWEGKNKHTVYFNYGGGYAFK
jgi:hypothetical protein